MQAWSMGWEDPLEKGMATYSNIVAWKVPWTEEPGRLQSTASHRVGHDWSDLACKCVLLQMFVCLFVFFFNLQKIHPFHIFNIGEPWGMWDLSSPTRNGTLHWKHRILTTGQPGKSPDVCGFRMVKAHCISDWLKQIGNVLFDTNENKRWYNQLCHQSPKFLAFVHFSNHNRSSIKMGIPLCFQHYHHNHPAIEAFHTESTLLNRFQCIIFKNE